MGRARNATTTKPGDIINGAKIIRRIGKRHFENVCTHCGTVSVNRIDILRAREFPYCKVCTQEARGARPAKPSNKEDLRFIENNPILYELRRAWR